MDLNIFLGFLHDKFIPKDLRKCIDTFPINISVNQMTHLSQNINKDDTFSEHHNND